MEEFGPPERVYIENDWFDGPRAGVADIHGLPHRFKLLFDESEDEYSDTCAVWPIDQAALDLEIEQWKIFMEWHARFEADTADVDSHPAQGGINPRWDQINKTLKQSREDVPANARRALFQMEWLDKKSRYGPDGPDYRLRWRLL
jgi:hypothetical protein